jgi:hypothetical protein
MLRIPDKILAFSQGNEDFYKFAQDTVNHYRAVKLNEQGLDYSKEISFQEKDELMSKMFRDEVAKLANVSLEGFSDIVWSTNPNVRHISFAIINSIIDVILPNTIIDSIGAYTEIRNGAFGDSFTFDIKSKDLFAVTKNARGKRKTFVQKQYEGQIAVLPVEHDVTVEVALYKVLAGKESLSEFVMKAIRSIETEMTYDVYDAFNTAMENLPTATPTGLKYTGYSWEKMVELAQKVTAFNGGAKAVILGTKLALSKVLPDDNNYRYMLDSDYVKIGYVRTAAGFDVMALEQVADYTNPYALKLDDNKLYIISPSSQKIVKLCLEGELLTNTEDIFANATLTQSVTMKKSYGVGVGTNATYALVEIE